MGSLTISLLQIYRSLKMKEFWKSVKIW